MGTPAVEKIGEIDEKERSKRVQLPHNPLLDYSNLDYSVTPSFKFQTLSSSIQNAPLITASDKTITSTAIDNRIELPKITDNVKDSSTENATALGYEIVKAIERNEEIVRGISDILINNIKGKNKLIVELSKEEQEKLNELLKQLRKNENADTVKSLLNVLTASSAIVVGSVLLAPEIAAVGGISALSSAAIFGILSIASGVTNLVSNEVMPRIGGYEKIASYFTSDEKEKQTLADNIQTASTITSTVLSITSALAASPYIGSVLGWANGAKKVFDTSLGLANGGANFVKDVGEYQLKNAQSEMTTIEAKRKAEESDLENAHSTMQSALDVQKAFNTLSANIVQELNEISQKDSRGQKTLNSNIQIEIANTAAESIKALNTNLSNRFIHIFTSKMDSQEASLKAATSQRNQAIPHGLSAVASFACSIAAPILKTKSFDNAASVVDGISKAGPQGADFFSRMYTKTYTIETDRSRFSEYDKQIKNNTKDNISSTIARTVEISSRLMQAAGAA